MRRMTDESLNLTNAVASMNVCSLEAAHLKFAPSLEDRSQQQLTSVHITALDLDQPLALMEGLSKPPSSRTG